MSTKEFCVYNETRESLLSSRVSVIDTTSDPLSLLKALIEGPAPNAETGLWLNPLKNLPSVPRISPYDLIYLDQDCRVIHGVELVPDAEVPHFNGQTASALVLPFRSFASSQTHPGDQVILRATGQAEQFSGPVPMLAAAVPASPGRGSSQEQSPANIDMDPPLWGASFGQPQAPVQQLDAEEIVLSRDRKSDSSKIPSWRALARLRVHISISLAPVQGAKPTPSLRRMQTARWALLRNRCIGRSRELMHQSPRPSIASFSTWVAKCASSAARELLRKYATWKVDYQRWAEVFVYGPERAAARAAVPGVQGAEFHARDEVR